MLGRPLKYSTPEEIEILADKYFADTKPEEWTITGLALALDTTRKTLIDYDEREAFSNTIKKLKTKVENQYEISLRKFGRSGDIFGLKNFGWDDKSQVQSNTNLSVTWNEDRTYEADSKTDQSD